MRAASLLSLPEPPGFGKTLLMLQTIVVSLTLVLVTYMTISVGLEWLFAAPMVLFAVEFFITPLGWMTLKHCVDKAQQ